MRRSNEKRTGRADAVTTDDIILSGLLAAADKTLKLVGARTFTTEAYGIGVKKGKTDMQKFIDESIQKFKDDGRWANAYEKWVGQYTGVEQEPPTMTLQEAIDLTK